MFICFKFKFEKFILIIKYLIIKLDEKLNLILKLFFKIVYGLCVIVLIL